MEGKQDMVNMVPLIFKKVQEFLKYNLTRFIQSRLGLDKKMVQLIIKAKTNRSTSYLIDRNIVAFRCFV